MQLSSINNCNLFLSHFIHLYFICNNNLYQNHLIANHKSYSNLMNHIFFVLSTHNGILLIIIKFVYIIHYLSNIHLFSYDDTFLIYFISLFEEPHPLFLLIFKELKLENHPLALMSKINEIFYSNFILINYQVFIVKYLNKFLINDNFIKLSNPHFIRQFRFISNKYLII